MQSDYDREDEEGYLTSYQTAAYGTSFPGTQPLYGAAEGGDQAQGFANDQKPKILLMGLRRSGKSSIQNVVFHKMSPNETLFLESTNKITTDDIANTSCVQFKILDFPGQIDFFDPSFDTENIFGGVGALVFVIDAQDDYIDAVIRLSETVSRVYKINPKLKFEVFIHKVDGLTDDTKIETQRDIHQRASDDLHEASLGIPGLENVHLHFYLTSIYDHSIFEAFSKVVQKLIPQLPTLENLLNIFNTNSGIEKSFLFDVSSKIYIATDYSPVDMQSYELCCDMIDVVLDISVIYGLEDDSSDHMSCFDSATYSVIKLNNSTVLLLWQVARYLALVCILREENYDRPGLIEYNYHCFRKGLLEIFEVRNHYLQLEQQQLEQRHKLQQQRSIGNNKSEDAPDGGGAAGSSLDMINQQRRMDNGGPQTSTPSRGNGIPGTSATGGAALATGDASISRASLGAVGNISPTSPIVGQLNQMTLDGSQLLPNASNTSRRESIERGHRASSTSAASGSDSYHRQDVFAGRQSVVDADVSAFSTITSGGGGVSNGIAGTTLHRRSSAEEEEAAAAYREGKGDVQQQGGYRTTSEYVPPPAQRVDDRRASASTAAGANAANTGLRQLARGHVITTGGSRSDTSTPVTGIVGNTYVMTDDAGMVLVNGAAVAADASSSNATGGVRS